MNIQLKDLQQAARAIGRGVVFRANVWAGTAALALTHLGDTEGDITVAANESYVHQTLPELTGPAKHESYVEGEDPVVTLPLFAADPADRAILTPTGNASGGYSRRRKVKEHTLVVFPEELFFNEESGAYDLQLSYTKAEGWKLGGEELNAEQKRLLALAMWFWRGYFNRAPVEFKHGDAGKTVASVAFQVMQSKLPVAVLPEGERLYTLGDPKEKQIELDPAPAP
jgi:hypothetical protein